MSDLIQVEYVGNKASACDNVARSGKIWNGKGDIQEVTADQARVLTKYPDQWQLVDAGKKAEVDATAIKTVQTNTDGVESVEVNVDAMNKPLENMSKAELVAFAKQKLERELQPNLSKKQMIDQIEEWQTIVG